MLTNFYMLIATVRCSLGIEESPSQKRSTKCYKYPFLFEIMLFVKKI